MTNLLCFLSSFLFLTIWSSIHVFAVDFDRSIPPEILRRFSKLEMNGNIIGFPGHHLTEEEFRRIRSDSDFSMTERLHATISGGDKRSLLDMWASVKKLNIRKIVEGSIDLIPIAASELNRLAREDEDVVLLLDLVEGRTLFSTLVMNLENHERLANLSSKANPIAQWYMAKLLKHFSVKQGDRLDLDSRSLIANARESFERLLEEGEVSFSLKGLYCEYLGNEHDAFNFFQRGVERGEAFAHYKIAQRKEYLGEEDALDFYEKAFILGYEKALADVGRLHTDDNTAFLILKKAGERGNAEAYFLIAQMTREGFVPLGGYSNDEQFWLFEGLKLNSLSCGFSLGRLCEKRGDLSQAIITYEELISWGNINGFLELGRIKENQRDFRVCEDIYKNPKIGWFGLYALAAITPDKNKKVELKKEAMMLFNSHFERIMAIVTEGLSRK